jgi:hypothetical protein
MNLFQWLNDNKLVIIIILSIGLVISIMFNIFAAPVDVPRPSSTATERLESLKSLTFDDIINSSAWAWVWPAGIGVVVSGIAIYNWKSVIDVQSNSSISSDICSIIPGTNSSVSRIPSLYFANLSFFFAYLFYNALSNYRIVSDKDVDIGLINNRKYRSIATMVVLLIVFLSIIILRYNTSHCDSIVGLLITVSTFTGLGLLWYKVAEFCGAKASDLMGISQNIVSVKAKAPVVCKRNPVTST